jgi:OmpA-like transmembrane domain
MKELLSLFAALAAACLMTPAQAQMATHGGYAGVGAMSVSTNNASDFAAAFIGPSGSGDKSATGFKVYGGYTFPYRFGIEAGYYDLGSYDVRTGGAKSDEFKLSAFAVSGTYTLPMGAGFDANFKLGLAFTNVDYTCVIGCGGLFFNSSNSGVAGLLGAGVAWNAARNFALRADFEYFGEVPHTVGALAETTYDYTAFSVSGQLRF